LTARERLSRGRPSTVVPGSGGSSTSRLA
jgi:hypothetical protein